MHGFPLPEPVAGGRRGSVASAAARGLVLTLASACALALVPRSAPGAQSRVAWLTGAPLRRQLAAPVDVFWAGTPLRHAIESLSQSQRTAVLIDRRVDPGQELDFQRNGLPLERVYQEIARSRELGITWLDAVGYLGPSRAAARLRTVVQLRREEAGRLPARAARRFLSPSPLRWEDFATPRDLLAELGGESRIEIVGREHVPHDLWAGADLPALSLVDRLTLIAVQFDLTFQLAADGSAVALVPLPDDVAVVRSYPGGRDPQALADRWAARVPESRIEVVGGEVRVRGRLEDHEQIADSARPPRHTGRTTNRTPEAREGEKRFTVRQGKGRLGPVIEQLATQLGLTVEIDRGALDRAGISLDRPITFRVEEGTLEELLEAVLAPAGCTFRLRGNVLEIAPAR